MESTQKTVQVKRLFSYGIPLNLLSPKTVDPFCGASKLKFAKPFKIVLDICMKNDHSKFHRNRSNRKYLKVGPTEISGERKKKEETNFRGTFGNFWQVIKSVLRGIFRRGFLLRILLVREINIHKNQTASAAGRLPKLTSKIGPNLPVYICSAASRSPKFLGGAATAVAVA